MNKETTLFPFNLVDLLKSLVDIIDQDYLGPVGLTQLNPQRAGTFGHYHFGGGMQQFSCISHGNGVVAGTDRRNAML
jgi:hypothetical protein